MKRKWLSVLMSVVMVTTLMALPSYAEYSVEQGTAEVREVLSDGSDSDGEINFPAFEEETVQSDDVVLIEEETVQSDDAVLIEEEANQSDDTVLQEENTVQNQEDLSENILASEEETPLDLLTSGEAPEVSEDEVTVERRGTCGEDLEWTITSDAVLRITGTGEMENYNLSGAIAIGSPPWYMDRTWIRKVIIEPGVSSIGYAAFFNCTLVEEIEIPDTVTKIGSAAFYNVGKMTSLALPEHITEIASDTFYGCSRLQTFTIPEGVKSIGNSAFYGCTRLETLILPEGVESIGDSAFYGCDSLNTLILPESVKSIGNSVFSSSLKYLTFTGDAPKFGEKAFNNKKLTVRYQAANTSWTEEIFQDYGGTVLWEAMNGDTPVVTVYSGQCGDNAFWTLENQVLTISGTGAIYNYDSFRNLCPWDSLKDRINEVVIQSGITDTGECAFENLENLTWVTLPDTLSVIGQATFCGCKKLTSVNIPKGVTQIGKSAFENCSNLTRETIPSGVTKLGSYAFAETGLTAVTIPLGISKLENGVFRDTKLTSVVIPGNVTSIGYDAFNECTKLASVYIPSSVSSIGAEAFRYCDALTSIIIPASVRIIEKDAFYYSGLKSITFKGYAPSISTAFYKVTATVYYPKNESSWNSKNMLQYGGTLTWIEDGISESCGENAYWEFSSIGELRIWGTGAVTSHPWDNYKSQIRKVIVGEGISSICDSAFSNCDILSLVTLPDELTAIGTYAFSGCEALASITIPEGVTTIDGCTFSGCTSLSNVSLPKKLKTINSEAFKGCEALTSITIPEGVTTIGGHAFYGCTSLNNVSLSKGLKTIKYHAFDGCKALTSITIPEGVTMIGGYAFYGCTSLNNVSLPKELKTIDYNAFDGCEALTSISIPEGVTVIDDEAFGNCKNLVSVELPGTLSSKIRDSFSVFSNCTNLQSVTIGEGATVLWIQAFENCKNLTYVSLPSTLTEINLSLFYGCTSLEEIVIPLSVEKIEDRAFYGCTKLRKITFEGSAPSIASDSFSGVTADVYYSSDDVSWTNDIMTNYGGDLTWMVVPTPTPTNTPTPTPTNTPTPTPTNTPTPTPTNTPIPTPTNTPTPTPTNTPTPTPTNTPTPTPTNTPTPTPTNTPTPTPTNTPTPTPTNTPTPTPIPAQNLTVELSQDSFVYNGGIHRPAVTVTDASGTEISSNYFRLMYPEESKRPGNYVVQIVFQNPYSGTVQKEYQITKARQTIQMSNVSKRLDGKGYVIQPNIVHGNSQGTVTYKSSNSEVAVVNGNGAVTFKSVGKTKITLTVKGNHLYTTTSTSFTLQVMPSPTSITKLTNPASGQLRIEWKSDANVSGYQVQFGTDPALKGGKTASVTSPTIRAHTRTDIVKGSTYYVRVRTYKLVDGERIYSNWSSIKSIQCK